LKRGHVAYRTCVGCLRSFPKAALLRFTDTADGVSVGSGTGRGYYLCRNLDCLRKALEKKNLSRRLGRAISAEDEKCLQNAVTGST
jgi:predicted RNA-binding protein YlxR (DUF448 family)